MSTLDKRFTAILQKSPNNGGWTYVVMPGSAEYFKTRGLVRSFANRAVKDRLQKVRQLLLTKK